MVRLAPLLSPHFDVKRWLRARPSRPATRRRRSPSFHLKSDRPWLNQKNPSSQSQISDVATTKTAACSRRAPHLRLRQAHQQRKKPIAAATSSSSSQRLPNLHPRRPRPPHNLSRTRSTQTIVRRIRNSTICCA